MYRSKDTKANDEFLEYLKKEIAPSNKKMANMMWRYYKTENYILDLLDYLRVVTNEEVKIPIGDFTSPVMIILKNIEDKEILDFFKYMFKSMKVDFNSLYFTCLDKSTKEDKNIDFLLKEIKMIKPNMIFAFSNIDSMLENIYHIKVPNGIFGLDTTSFKEMIMLNDIPKENLTEEDKTELTIRKNYVWNRIKFIIPALKGYTSM